MCWLSTHLLPWTLEPAGYLQPQTGACRAEETQAGIQTLTSALQFSPYMKAEAGACPQPQHQTSENPQQSTIEQPQLPKSCCWRNTPINPALSLGRRRCPSHHSTRAVAEVCITQAGKLQAWPQIQHRRGQTLLITRDHQPTSYPLTSPLPRSHSHFPNPSMGMGSSHHTQSPDLQLLQAFFPLMPEQDPT